MRKTCERTIADVRQVADFGEVGLQCVWLAFPFRDAEIWLWHPFKTMCGRFTLRTPPSDLAQLFLFDLPPDLDLPPRYNIAPTQPAPIVRRIVASAERELATPRWGLVPSWAKDPKIGARAINARAETAAEKPMFRAAFRRRRCLVLADGYFEWKKEKGGKQPYYIRLRDERPFAFAGLWDRWTDENDHEAKTLETFTILTTEANVLTMPLHERMPVILWPEDHQAWLDETNEQAQDLLRPFSPEEMTFNKVNRVVNNVRNDSPKCIEPIQELF